MLSSANHPIAIDPARRVSAADMVDDRFSGLWPIAKAAELAPSFARHNECIVLYDYVPRALVDVMAAELAAAATGSRSKLTFLRRASHLGYRWIAQHAPVTTAFYQSPALLRFLATVIGKPQYLKHNEDDHACTAYAYSRAGDGMTYHLDGCGCGENESYSILISLVDESTQRLLIDHHHLDPSRRWLQRVRTSPGTVTIFCGSKTRHAVSALGKDERRLILSLATTTNPAMTTRRRMFENIKDSLLYFGPSALFQQNYGAWRARAASPQDVEYVARPSAALPRSAP